MGNFMSLVQSIYKQRFSKQKPSLVLDLDHILIIKTQLKTKNSDFFVTGKRKTYVQIRPEATSFLKKISKYYTVYFFTSDDKDISLKIIHKIAPFISDKQCFFKDSCLFAKGYPIKDLRLIGKPLSNIVMVDTIIGCAMLQPFNCIGIASWDGEARDDVLISELLPLLIDLQKNSNMQEAIKQKPCSFSHNFFYFNCL